MVREILKYEDNKEMLSTACKLVTRKDLDDLQDLLDTAESLKEKNCCGLAANQIGYPLRAIALYNGEDYTLMLNPAIVGRSKTKIDSEEGCLSFSDRVVKMKRHAAIEVIWYDKNFKQHKNTFSDAIACVIQHEIGHLNGKIEPAWLDAEN